MALATFEEAIDLKLRFYFFLRSSSAVVEVIMWFVTAKDTVGVSGRTNTIVVGIFSRVAVNMTSIYSQNL